MQRHQGDRAMRRGGGFDRAEAHPPSPRGEGLPLVQVYSNLELFQSTLPVRGGTAAFSATKRGPADFNPPSPCGEGRPA